MSSALANKRSIISFLIALVVHILIVIGGINYWQGPATLEPLKDVTHIMTIITTAKSTKSDLVSLPELSTSILVQKKEVSSLTAAPAAPRKALNNHKAHKAVAPKAHPNLSASTAEALRAPLPTAVQVPENVSSQTNVSNQQPNDAQSKQHLLLSASAIKDIAGAYRTMVHGRIAALQQYPVSARRLEEEGTVLVRFTILASGKIADVSIVESSGSQSLDEAAIAIFMQGLNGQLPPIPIELNKTKWTLSLPIRYQLQS
jgi:protein TonB